MSAFNVSMIKGVFAPIATPFTDAGGLDFASLKKNMQIWDKTRLAGYVVLGSNGEANFLTFDEKVRLVAEVAELNGGRKLVIAGTGVETTTETIRLTAETAKAGAQAALVLPPFYFKAAMGNAALITHYKAVADASPIPIMLYNMPGNTGLNLTSGLVAELSHHPNIIGIKDSGGNIVQIAEIVAKSKPGFIVFAGSGSFLLPTLAVGGRGTTAALANIAADELADIYDAFMANDMQKAKEAQLKVMDINAAVTSRWGVPGLKAAMDMMGYIGGRPRLPMLPLPEKERAELAKIVEAFRR
ncbi:MAG TPA: 4-hydroxy-tetrahydrodipicolinate synthase [Bacillota bacterium]|nr:4-hydroxy-tetrahydrodipicolinate synthase [Bacillota bacterium]HOH10043.1 4-hydroxy-tetrahydrodipicolinate synthase [Bacillota bacterium]HOY88722.1 4-hydroxy-tetrahydrodipicolinate synthase [Bacillota bacterium]HPI01395.1 4-hydroxy-tetrahydrodipicolinate synthase [Bacillota bacterium]HPM63250.1 4-hydroxy-tetrahydrodipicolinate synthase [Bacillota bacterium]